MVGTSKLKVLYGRFEEELGRRQESAKEARPKWEPPRTKLDEDQGTLSAVLTVHSDPDNLLCIFSCFDYIPHNALLSTITPQIDSCFSLA